LKSVDIFASADAFINLGNVALMMNNEVERALMFYEHAQQLSPNDGEIAFNIAVCYDKVSILVFPSSSCLRLLLLFF
jgi:hypothetical protein